MFIWDLNFEVAEIILGLKFPGPKCAYFGSKQDYLGSVKAISLRSTVFFANRQLIIWDL